MPSKQPPGPLDLDHDRYDVQPPRPSFMRDLPSPRTGEAPPALSPLDAIAQHSRMLAAKFEAEAQKGRRLSRLQPDIVSRELANRPGYFRSVSNETDNSGYGDLPQVQEDEQRPATRGEVSHGGWKNRPISHYPRLSTGTSEDVHAVTTPFFDAPEQPLQGSRGKDVPLGYFDIPRASSPEQVDPRFKVEAPSPLLPSLTSSIDSFQSHKSTQPRKWTNGSGRSQHTDSSALAPPQSPALPRLQRSIQSIRSVRSNSGDEESSPVNGTAPQPSSRKFSASSSVLSRPRSPFSPWITPMDRSPSTTSQSSMANSQHFPRAAQFNFSRPMSSHRPSNATRPSFDSRASFETRPSFESPDPPNRHPSAASQASNSTKPSTRSTCSRQNSERGGVPAMNVDSPLDTTNTLEGASSDYFLSNTEAPNSTPGPTPTSTKYTLPRGRSVKRTSAETRNSWINKQFDWDNSDHTSFALPERPLRQDSGKSIEPPVATPAKKPPANDLVKQTSANDLTKKPAIEDLEQQERQSRARAFSSANRSHSADTRQRNLPPASRFHKYSDSVRTDNTDSSDRTLRPSPLHQRSASAELTPEEHLEIGIQAHARNELNKSTYHLRLAAKAGLPTGMLLYALACRHGWGMRANQEEGVMWLKKAIDSSQLEVASIEASLARASRIFTGNPLAEYREMQKRKAQLTHAIYELGQSHMNGWGCPKDPALALQCYEVAGSWGDADCLAEAGYCYTKGLGKKKDLKKAAALYRKAAEAGVSMAGNSWIYKPKYMEAAAPASPITEFRRVGTPTHNDFSDLAKMQDKLLQEQRPSSRLRQRSIWGRKK